MPPATPKFAFAPDGVPVIQPPPVMKSAGVHPGGGGGGGAGAQVMSACAEEMITSATPSTLTWRALTVMSPEPALVCSLMTTLPFGNSTVWYGVPSTWTTCPLDRKSTRLNSSHLVISYAVFCLKKKKNNKKSRYAYTSY